MGLMDRIFAVVLFFGLALIVFAAWTRHTEKETLLPECVNRGGILVEKVDVKDGIYACVIEMPNAALN